MEASLVVVCEWGNEQDCPYYEKNSKYGRCEYFEEHVYGDSYCLSDDVWVNLIKSSYD